MRLLLLVAALALLGIAACADVKFMNFPTVFGNIADPKTIAYYADACRKCVLADTGMFYTHDNACNTVIRCVPWVNSWLVFGYVMPQGNLFNEESLSMVATFTNGRPNKNSCRRVGHPCDTGKRIPVDADACNGYMVCNNNVMEKRACANNLGFNVITQDCDLPCVRRQRTVISKTCTRSNSEDYYMMEQRVKYSDKSGDEIERFRLRCTLGYKYKTMGKCSCDPHIATEAPCTTINVLYLRSNDDSWRAARANRPLNGGSSLTGNGTFVNDRITNFLYAPFFNAASRQVFSAPRLWGNDLGLYFDISFRFLAVNSNGVAGLSRPVNNLQHSHIALADNSACGIHPTYGCRLDYQSQDRGYVVCYVQPDKVSTSGNSIEVISALLDLTKTIDVYFAKDNQKGILKITEGNMERTKQFSFPRGVRALGNACPFSIGAGTNRHYFHGYIFKMEIKKYCGPFM